MTMPIDGIPEAITAVAALRTASCIGRTNRMPSTLPEYEANTGYAGTGRWLDRWARHGLQADAGQGRTRTRGIGDAEVAVLQGESDESGDPVRSRASVKGLRIHGNAKCRRPLLPGDVFQNPLDHIRSRHIINDA